MQTYPLREAAIAPSKVIIAASSKATSAGVETPPKQLSQKAPEVDDMAEFPSLSAQCGSQQATLWKPATDGAPESLPELSLFSDSKAETSSTLPDPAPESESIQSSAMHTTELRSGSNELFDGCHPRNQFARKPRRQTTADGAPREVVEDGFVIVDWSSSGTTGVSGVMLQQSANPAHLSPYMKPEPPVDLTVLKQVSQQCATKQFHQQPQHCRHSTMVKRDRSKQPRVRCR